MGLSRSDSISQYGTEARIVKPAGNRMGQKMIGHCVICDKLFQITNKYGSRRKSCSMKCRNILRSRLSKVNGSCPPSQTGKRWGIDYPMEKHNWWKGGISPLRRQIWHSDNFQEWRNAIFERDNYSCALCGRRGCSLNVDHYPVTFSEILEVADIKALPDAVFCEKLWDLNNGRTLCVECHRKTDTYGRWNRFRKERTWL